MCRNRLLLLVLSGVFLAPFVPVRSQGPEHKVVYTSADETRPLHITPDSAATNLRGNVVLYHEGAIITCDSAVRYSPRYMKCYGNVVVNKDSTFIYGDALDYNGDEQMATVFAPIIKMVDGDATLYTHHLTFNTRTSVAMFSGGGTMRQGDNLLESAHGYYYTDTRDAIFVHGVEMSNPDYKLMSDSAGYNVGTEIASIFTESTIWNANGEILNATSGTYDTRASEYFFTSDSYVLTDVQEMWSDTLRYNSVSENAELFGNIQLHDMDYSVLGFGDHGIYWGKQQDAQLSRNPSIIYYDREQTSDSLYMRADSIFLLTGDRMGYVDESQGDVGQLNPGERVHGQRPLPAVAPDGTGGEMQTDSIMLRDSVALVKDIAAGDEDSDDDETISPEDDGVAVRDEDDSEDTTPPSPPDEVLGVTPVADPDAALRDSLALARTLHEEIHANFPPPPRPGHADMADTLGMADSVAVVAADSTYKMVRAYRNVKFYRSDFQGVCDSLFANSIDSVIHMRIDPVMWNGKNQIMSDNIDIHTRNQQLYRAIFTEGSPIMSSQVDSVRFNQVKGKQIIAHFVDNVLTRADVIGNAQTKYYIVDEETGYVQGLWDIESADMTFFIVDQEVERIVWRGNPQYSIYPIDMIPADVELILPGFSWEIERRPERHDVFDRTVRTSRRDHFEALEQPRFERTESIRKYIENLIKNGLWFERNDVINDEAWERVRQFEYDFPSSSFTVPARRD